MLNFKGVRFPIEVILVCIRWYVAYPLSYRHLEEMMQERGVLVDHSSINRWSVRFLPHSQVKYLNNIVGQDHRAINRSAPPARCSPASNLYISSARASSQSTASMQCRSPANFLRWQEWSVQFDGQCAMLEKFRPLISNATEPAFDLKHPLISQTGT